MNETHAKRRHRKRFDVARLRARRQVSRELDRMLQMHRYRQMARGGELLREES